MWNRHDIFDYIWIHMDHSWCMMYIDMYIYIYCVCGHFVGTPVSAIDTSPGHQASSRESWSLPATRDTVPLQRISMLKYLQCCANSHLIVCQAFLFVKRFSLQSELTRSGNAEVVQLLDNSLSTNDDVLVGVIASCEPLGVSRCTQAQATGLRGGRDVWCFHPRPSSKLSRWSGWLDSVGGQVGKDPKLSNLVKVPKKGSVKASKFHVSVVIIIRILICWALFQLNK